MASFPGSKVHRPSRRKLGRGQHVQLPAATAVATASTVTVTITFNVPVIVKGNINLHVIGGPTLVSQTITSQTVVTQVYSATVVGDTYTLDANDPTISTYQGGGNAGTAGTF